MSKTFDSLQQLWSYCLFCPLCQEITRDLHVAVGPDDVFTLGDYDKKNHFLTLECIAKIKRRKYNVNFHINGLDNTFDVDFAETVSENHDCIIEKSKLPYFYFYIQGDCWQCDSTFAASTDLELNLLDKKIYNIGLETETIFVSNESIQYHITINYNDNNMIITRCRENENGTMVDDDKPFHSPIVDLDLSNPDKVIRKIKTILVFS